MRRPRGGKGDNVALAWRTLRCAAGAVVLLAALCSGARADVGLMLNEALRTGASRWTGAGHAAVYLSGLCAESPLELRECRAGENGVVLTNYHAFGEDQPHRWNAIPLNIYLYGVEDEGDRALYATPTVRWLLQERYRERYMGAICHGACATNANALWRESIASTFERDIYMFMARTTPEQDRALLAKLRQMPNTRHTNGWTSNCADFVREVVNSYFPGAARPDYVNDFGMTSPKAIAKSFTHYAVRHPEIGFRVVRYSQTPGEFKTSQDNRKGMERLFRANKWRVPLALLRPEALAVAGVSYLATGRFNPERELQRRPTAEASALQADLQLARAQGDEGAVQQARQKLRAAQREALGSVETWDGYAAELRQYEAEAVQQGLVSEPGALQNPEAALLPRSWITVQEGGGMWLVARDGRAAKIGLSVSTLSSSQGDPRAAYVLALARVGAELQRKPKRRETLQFFRRDWAQLQRLRMGLMASSGTPRQQASSRAAE